MTTARLDLIQLTQDGFAVGEIKPANAAGLFQGDADLIWYEQQIQRIIRHRSVRGLRVSRMLVPAPPGPYVFPNPGLPPQCQQEMFVQRWPTPGGIYAYSCEPDYSVLVRNPMCRCRRGRQPDPVRVPARAPAPQPARAPRSTMELIREFVETVGRGVDDVDRAADRFAREHPEFAAGLAAALATAAVALVVLTILEDIGTGGVGIADDPASFAAAWALLRAGLRMAGAM